MTGKVSPSVLVLLHHEQAIVVGYRMAWSTLKAAARPVGPAPVDGKFHESDKAPEISIVNMRGRIWVAGVVHSSCMVHGRCGRITTGIRATGGCMRDIIGDSLRRGVNLEIDV